MVDYLQELGAEACSDRDFISDLNAEVMEFVDYKHKPHVAAGEARETASCLF